jgi:trehalose synthase-fused probable maltokinase
MRPVGDADLATWVDKATAMLDRSMASLKRGSESIRDGDTAREVMERARDIRNRLDASIDAIGTDRGSRTRIHGDYHLGQVIRSESGGRNADYLVIDFEGEPARPLSERRLHQSPLRDVAGMLRSFAYASAVGAREAGKGHAQERAADWERVVREAFLEGYFRKTDGPARMLPSSRANAEQLIALFETEKVFYELQYELDHRPDWVWIPLRGIAQLDT